MSAKDKCLKDLGCLFHAVELSKISRLVFLSKMIIQKRPSKNRPFLENNPNDNAKWISKHHPLYSINRKVELLYASPSFTCLRNILLKLIWPRKCNPSYANKWAYIKLNQNNRARGHTLKVNEREITQVGPMVASLK